MKIITTVIFLNCLFALSCFSQSYVEYQDYQDEMYLNKQDFYTENNSEDYYLQDNPNYQEEQLYPDEDSSWNGYEGRASEEYYQY